MASFNMPAIGGQNQDIKKVYSYLQMLNNQLRYTLNNITPEDNFTQESFIKYQETDTTISQLEVTMRGFLSQFTDLANEFSSSIQVLDGKIARKYNLVTNFGKFMDPLADKLLVCSAMICLIPSGKLDAAIVIVIIAREFIISGFRLVASDAGIVIAASYWGKFKTVFQMAMIIVLIADFGGVFDLIGTALIWIAVALTVISLIDYVWKNRQVLTQGGM